MPCTPQKPEGATARTTQLAQKLEKTSKTYKTERLPFPITFHHIESSQKCILQKRKWAATPD